MSDLLDTLRASGHWPPFPPKAEDGSENWVAACSWYCENKRATYEDVAEILGVSRITVARRAGASGENWPAARVSFQADLVQEALMSALANKVKGAAALIQYQYDDALDILSKLREQRAKSSKTWSTRHWRDHIAAIESIYNLARQALGLPKEFTAEATSSYEELLEEIERSARDAPDELEHENL